MSFVSENFIFFLIVLFPVYYLVPKKWQPSVLLAASYFFYLCSGLRNFAFVLLTTASTYGAGLWLSSYSRKRKAEQSELDLDRDGKKRFKAVTQKHKRLIVTLTLLLNFGVLAYVKYFSYFLQRLSDLLVSLGKAQLSVPSILLPLGISFFTFQSVGYVFDVYREKFPAQKNIFKYALFVSFFPQMVQGPIGRYDTLEPQLLGEHAFNANAFKHACMLILWGFFKKMVVADRLSLFVSEAYGSYAVSTGLKVFLTGLIYGLQIYGDFSGGIDITRGVARALGIEMDENFNQPFFSTSMADFWRRWHMSLGAWMRDYVFYPFALSKTFNNVGKWGRKHLGNVYGKLLPTCIISFINFLLIGIWHGPNFKFIIYGLYNALLISGSIMLEPGFQKICAKLKFDRNESKAFRVFRMIRTTCLVTFGRLIGHSADWPTAKIFLRNMFVRSSAGISWKEFFALGTMTGPVWTALIIAAAAVFVRDVLAENNVDFYAWFDRIWRPLQSILLVLFILIILVFGVYGFSYDGASFLYGAF